MCMTLFLQQNTKEDILRYYQNIVFFVVASWPARPKNIDSTSGVSVERDYLFDRPMTDEGSVWEACLKINVIFVILLCFAIICNSSAEITALTSDHELKWSGLLVLQRLQAKAKHCEVSGNTDVMLWEQLCEKIRNLNTKWEVEYVNIPADVFIFLSCLLAVALGSHTLSWF